MSVSERRELYVKFMFLLIELDIAIYTDGTVLDSFDFMAKYELRKVIEKQHKDFWSEK